ncbi:hypothetical protein PMAYCL1PPCAC_09311, partial [Pristionchus mayeri]
PFAKMGVEKLGEWVLNNLIKVIISRMSYFSGKCYALFGSSEYYNQCRMATHFSQSAQHETVDEHRFIRLFHNMRSAADEQTRKVDAQELDLVDQVMGIV